MLAAPRTDTRDASAVARFESSLAALSRAARSEAELRAAHAPAAARPTPPPVALSALAVAHPLEVDDAALPDNVINLPVRVPAPADDTTDELDLATELRGSLYLLGAMLGPVLAVAAFVS